MILAQSAPSAPDLPPLHLVWSNDFWLPLAAVAAAVLLVLLAISYRRTTAAGPTRFLAAGLKALGIILLAICLLEPLFAGKHAKPGANQFVILADNSQSMTLKDPDGKSRGEQIKSLVSRDAGKQDAPWLTQFAKDFDVKAFSFDSLLHDLHAPGDLSGLAYDGKSTDMGGALERVVRRFDGRPLAGIILLTDGSATDTDAVDRVIAESKAAGASAGVPPIYPVLIGKPSPAPDVGVDHVDVTQTSFEDAPVTLAAEITSSGMQGKTLVADLLDESGKSVQQQKYTVDGDGDPIMARFLVKPDQIGLSFYRVRAYAADEQGQFDHPETSKEATLANNTRTVAVDRGRGPFRVLYVAGRPNWEFKFLNRAEDDDKEVQLAGLIRVAKREPKFQFMGRPGQNANPLFEGFNNQTQPDEDSTEYDKPIMERINTADDKELAGGFPKTADELFSYHAIILQDMESEFFTADQMQLISDFVRKRGGGLMMLGGEESFKNGDYDKTVIGDLLPVYIDQVEYPPDDQDYSFDLTKEGWLEPFLRLHSDETADLARIDSLKNKFTIINPVRGIKPGATVLARASAASGASLPALVEQRFGKGRTAALLVGDMWKWELQRADNSDTDFEKNWRQLVRWLVSDVPDRVTLASDPANDPDYPGALRLSVRVKDSTFTPLDNAGVTITVTGPDKKTATLHADANSGEPGLYQALYLPRLPGPYRAQANADGPDTHPVGQAQIGWASDPAADEFRDLQPNAALLERIARATGGEMIPAADLPKFAAGLPLKKAQITEAYVMPFWHQSWVFLLAIACLAAEWGLRRWKGLP